MEQGTIVLLAKGTSDDKLNISSNCSGEIVLENSGKIINQED